MSHSTRVTAILLVLGTTAACSKKPETAPAPTVNADSVARVRADSATAAQAAATAKIKADSVAAAQAVAQAAADKAAAAAAVVAARRADMVGAVYFDFDASVLTDTAKKLLDRKIALMNANPGVGIQIAGHTDERGSSEYNLALGQRRAASVKRYLTQHGIATARITIISFGEERPAAPGHDEAAYALNRRAEFVITIGDVTVGP